MGVGAKESSTSEPAQVTAGMILATVPSDFANSKHIVSCHQFSTSINSMELFSGGLRFYLLLHMISSGRTVGLLRCGPEYDLEQAVGIPLVQTTSEGADEYIRPRGCAAVLQQTPAQNVSPKLIYIRNDSYDGKMTTGTDQQYLLYDGFAEMNLELLEVTPESY